MFASSALLLMVITNGGGGGGNGEAATTTVGAPSTGIEVSTHPCPGFDSSALTDDANPCPRRAIQRKRFCHLQTVTMQPRRGIAPPLIT
jgi:hypothetical protein